MSKLLDSSKDKIQTISDILKNETLEPAKHEAARLISDAHEKAKMIIAEAEAEGERLIQEAHKEIQKERGIFENSLATSVKQAFLKLRQAVDEELFNSSLESELAKETSDPKVIAKLVDALIAAVETEGSSADVSVFLGRSVSKEAVAKELARETLKIVSEGAVSVGDFPAGVVVKLSDRKLSLVVDDEVLKELIGQFVRSDFRELLFKAK